MTLREFFNGILTVIGSTSLTDLEYSTMSGAPGYTLANYEQLAAVVKGRESVSGALDRLTFYFKARGTEIPDPVTVGSSNIFIGAVL